MDTLMITLLSGVLGAIAGAIISIFYQNKHYKGNLVEKWISNLRDEISNLLGLTEELRLKRQDDKLIGKVKDQDKNLHIIVAKQKKIHMLLNDKKVQTELYDSVKKIIEIADNSSMSYTVYERAEEKLVEQTRLLLREEWRNISRFSWKLPAILFLLFIVIPLVVDYNYEYLAQLTSSLFTKP